MRMHDVVDLVTSDPPPLRHTVDDIVRRGERVRRRRRAGWSVSAVAVLAVTIVVTTVAMPPRTVHPPTLRVTFPLVPAASFIFTFSGYQFGSWTVGSPTDVSTAYQIAPVYNETASTPDPGRTSPNGPESLRPVGYLTLYDRDAYNPTTLQDPRNITIAGHPGLESTGADLYTLSWRYADNAWAVITSFSTDDGDAEQLRQLAAVLEPSTAVPARLPFTMTYVPSGYHADEVAMHMMVGMAAVAAAVKGDSASDYAGVRFDNPALPRTGLTEPFSGSRGGFMLLVIRAANAGRSPSSGIICHSGSCDRWADDSGVDVRVASGGALSDSEMTKILNGVTLGDVRDDSTWTAATNAIP